MANDNVEEYNINYPSNKKRKLEEKHPTPKKLKFDENEMEMRGEGKIDTTLEKEWVDQEQGENGRLNLKDSFTGNDFIKRVISMKSLKFALPVIGLLTLSACTTAVYEPASQNMSSQPNTIVAKSSTNYIPLITNYQITPQSFQQTSDIRAFETGAANKWQLNGGDALSSYMQSANMQSHFKSLQSGNKGQLNLVMNVENCSFSDHYASVTIHVAAYQNGKQILSQSYSGIGPSETTKMWLAEGWGMKSAVQESTNGAISNALNGMLSDLYHAIR